MTAKNVAADSTARGKALRKKLPRKEFGDFAASDRSALQIIAEQSSRCPEDIQPIRNALLAKNRLNYLLGSGSVMAADLAVQPNTGLSVQLLGDAHVHNFGGHATVAHSFVFDGLSFADTCRGPFDWDLKRLAVTAVVAGQEAGLSRSRSRALAEVAAKSYQDAMRGFADESTVDMWYSRLTSNLVLSRWAEPSGAKTLAEILRGMKRARSRTGARAARKMTKAVDGELRFRSKPPLLEPVAALAADGAAVLTAAKKAWQQHLDTLGPSRAQLLGHYRLVDLARLIGSVSDTNVPVYAGLLLGPAGAEEPLIVALQGAFSSVLADDATEAAGSAAGQLIVGRRLIQAAPEPFLGELQFADHTGVQRQWVMSQVRDWKGALDLARTGERGLPVFVGLCGWALARAHARTGDRHEIAGYLGRGKSLVGSIGDFSEQAAAKATNDYRAFLAAIDKGDLPITS